MRIYIRGMSAPRKEIRNKLIDMSDPVYLHLTKLIMYPDSEYVNGWKKEVYAFLHKISKEKSNKYPSYHFIFNALSTNLDVPNQYIAEVQDEMMESNIDPIEVTPEHVQSILTEYASWISRELSSIGFVRIQDVYDWIDENILNKE